MKHIYLLAALLMATHLIQAQGSAENDLTLSDVAYANYQPDTDTNYRHLEYSIYHYSQIRPFTFSGIATNSGSNTQSGVQLKVTISNNWSYSETLFSDTFSLAPAMDQEIYIEDYTPPNQLGDYSISYELMSDAQDENLADNFGEKAFEISWSIMARDHGVSTGGFTDFSEIFQNGFKVGSFFHIEETITLVCIYVALSDLSIEGTWYNTQLLDSEFNFMVETPAMPVNNSQVNSVGEGNFVKTCLEEYVELEAGEDYFIAFVDFGLNDAVVAVENGVEPNSSFVRSGAQALKSLDVKPMIRMGFYGLCDCISGIESKVQVDASNLYPNPASDQLRLEYTLLESTQLEMTITDVNGKMVHRESTGKLPVGEHRSTFDIKHLPRGMYALNIILEGEVITNKFMVQR